MKKILRQLSKKGINREGADHVDTPLSHHQQQGGAEGYTPDHTGHGHGLTGASKQTLADQELLPSAKKDMIAQRMRSLIQCLLSGDSPGGIGPLPLEPGQIRLHPMYYFDTLTVDTVDMMPLSNIDRPFSQEEEIALQAAGLHTPQKEDFPLIYGPVIWDCKKGDYV